MPDDESNVEIVKAVTDTGLVPGIAPMPPIESTIDGEAIAWPVDQQALFVMYCLSTEHTRCCQIKAEGAFGGGVQGKGADLVKRVLPRNTGAAAFFSQLGLDLEAYGNAFAERIKAGGRTIGLRYRPARTMYVRKQGGFLQQVYEVDGDIRIIRFKDDEIIHFKVPCPAGFHYSLPSWIAAEGMLELVDAAVRFNKAFFRNHGVPEWAVVFEGAEVSPEKKAAIAGYFRREFQGPDQAYRALMLHAPDGSKVNFHKLTAEIKDADFIKLLESSRDRIVTAHGVPPRLLGIMQAGQLGGGGEVQGQLHVFETLAIAPRRRIIRDQLGPILAEGGMEVDDLEFVKPDLTPPGDDRKELAGLVGAGILTQEEARRILGMEKSGGPLDRLLALYEAL